MLRQASKYLFSGLDRFLPSPGGPRILIYHQVGPDLGRQMEVTFEDFETQLTWLKDHYEVVPLENALQRWDEPDSERLVVLTFDDGYEDTYATAYPLLEAMQLPFTLYLATLQVEKPDTTQPGAEPITWSQVNQMLASGLLTIGAHTHSHADLRGLSSQEITEELATSDALIEERTGIGPRHFAYPWGYWSDVANSVIRTRYDSAVLGGSPNSHRPFNPHQVSRYPVQLSDGSRFFASRLDGGLLIEERVRRRLRGYRGP